MSDPCTLVGSAFDEWHITRPIDRIGDEVAFEVRRDDTGAVARLRTATRPGPSPLLLAQYGSWAYIRHPVWSRPLGVVRLPDGRPGLLIDGSAPPDWPAFDRAVLEPADWVRAAVTLSDALAALHAEGIGYGSMRPRQVRVDPDGGGRRVRVIGLSAEPAGEGGPRTLPDPADDQAALARLFGACPPVGASPLLDDARAILARGAERDPGARFPNMASLCAALTGLLGPGGRPSRDRRPTLDDPPGVYPALPSPEAEGRATLEALPAALEGDLEGDTDEVSLDLPFEPAGSILRTAAEMPIPSPPVERAAEVRPGLAVEGLPIPPTCALGPEADRWTVPTVVPGGVLRHRLRLRPTDAATALGALRGARITAADGAAPGGLEATVEPVGRGWPLPLDRPADLDLVFSFADARPPGPDAPLRLHLTFDDGGEALPLELPRAGRRVDATLLIDIGASAIRFAALVDDRLRPLPDPSTGDDAAHGGRADPLGAALLAGLQGAINDGRLAPRDVILLPSLDDDALAIERHRRVVRRILPAAPIRIGLAASVAAALSRSGPEPLLVVDVGRRSTHCIAVDGATVHARGRIDGGGRGLGRALAAVEIFDAAESTSPAPADDREPPAGAMALFRLPTRAAPDPRAAPALPWRIRAADGEPQTDPGPVDRTDCLRRIAVQLEPPPDDPARARQHQRFEAALRDRDPAIIDALGPTLGWSVDGEPPTTLSPGRWAAVRAVLCAERTHGARLDAACDAIARCAWSVARTAWGEAPDGLDVILTGRGARGTPLAAALERQLPVEVHQPRGPLVFDGAVRWRARGHLPTWPGPDRLGFRLLQLAPEAVTLFDADCHLRRAVAWRPLPTEPITLAVAWGDEDPRICATLDPPSGEATALKIRLVSDPGAEAHRLEATFVALPAPLDALTDAIEHLLRSQPPMPDRDDLDGALDAWWATPEPRLDGERAVGTPQVLGVLGEDPLVPPAQCVETPPARRRAQTRITLQMPGVGMLPD